MVDVAKWVDTAAARRSTAHSSQRAPRREQIVVAATRAIEEHGLGVGTAQVAETAGVARPHVYRHFDSKADLDDEVARYAANQLLERVRPTLVGSGRPEELIHAIVTAAVAWASENPNLYRFMAIRQQTKASHRARLGRTRFLSEIVDAAAAYLRAIDIDTDIPDGILAGLMGMVDASIIWWLDHHDEAEHEVVGRVTRQVWLILRQMLEDRALPVSDDLVLSLPRAPGHRGSGARN